MDSLTFWFIATLGICFGVCLRRFINAFDKVMNWKFENALHWCALLVFCGIMLYFAFKMIQVMQ